MSISSIRKLTKLSLNRKIYRLACACVAAVGLMVSVLTLAFFYSQDEVTNRVSAADIEILLQEPEWEDNGLAQAQHMQPGMIIDKDPQVYNKSDGDVLVRMCIKCEGSAVDDTHWLLNYIDVNSTDFHYSDGWYYYYKNDEFTRLAQGMGTVPLFEKITIPTLKTDYAYFANGLNVTVQAQGISAQAAQGMAFEDIVEEFEKEYGG